MKKTLLLLLLLLMPLVANAWLGSSDYYSTDTPFITSVSNSSVAGCWYTLSGTQQRVAADTGAKETTQAYQIAITDGSTTAPISVDFFYAYSNTPTAYFPWLQTLWGPLQTKQQPPNNGICVSVINTSNTCSAYVERKY